MGGFKEIYLNQAGLCDRFASEDYARLKERVEGLHRLLPEPLSDSARMSYSILIPVYRPNPIFFEKALRSALDQTAPRLEVLVGFDGPQPKEVEDVINRLREESPRARECIQVVHCDRARTGGGISRTTNELAEKARGRFLLFMDHDDWIRPDLLYRYEQTLRLMPDPEVTVLYCNEYKINEKDEAIASSFFWKPEQPIFPYLFINFICHCLLVPRDLFVKSGRLRPECDGAQDYDLCLRLDLAGARFQNVPFFLYAWRIHSGSTAKDAGAKEYVTAAGIRALGDYAQAKGLDWGNFQKAYFPTSYRAEPRIHGERRVQVIIPFKDQREMTLKAMRSIEGQKGQGLSVQMTFVDNKSSDRGIGTELEAGGAEVLSLQEAFNFSRINNYAVANSTHQDCPYILFMNNDVELDPNALYEMLRWIDQPRIGMVGCRLHYPDGTLQHGGLELSPVGPAWRMEFRSHDALLALEKSFLARVHQVTEAVTAAAVLIRRDVFRQVGGFDEQWYPIAYSDTDLARRLRKRGLYSFYTPDAFGVHHESKSRGFSRFEEMESSRWLYEKREESGSIEVPLS